ncbi:MAG: hypothetical protein SOX66_00860, partial [Gemmiger qucibialis]|nr:hypothetical protein [Gemmiger qucibialis]
CEGLLPPKHDAGTATRHYRAFWQRRCRAAAAGAVLKPQGGNCAVLPYKLHGFCISKCKVAGGVCQAPVFLRKIVDVKVCEIYPAGLEKQV